ncbi:hypothetical protein [Streptomyces sp. NBC_00987]|uniref:hypothetical protein n=1 Tax=Streptomyces sp. NBC_00987 TaxID=2903703 RepID=UPI003870B32B|nr:hypothetical protein OG355_41025 [Streptomyces sp. NBC_00987]
MHSQESSSERDDPKAPKVPEPRAEPREEQRPPQMARRTRSTLDLRSVQRLQRGAGNAAVSRLLAAQQPPAAPLRQGPTGGAAGQGAPAGPVGQAEYAGQASGGAGAQEQRPGGIPPGRGAVPGGAPGAEDAAGDGVAGLRPAAPRFADSPSAGPRSARPLSVREARDDEKPGRPERDGAPADASALPERLPDGGAAAAAATVNARQGELRAARTGQRPAASLLKEHRKAQEGEGKGAPGRERGPHPGEEEGEQGRDQDRDRGHQRREGGRPPDGPGRGAQGADQGGDGSDTGFTELDVEPLMPPLWGQSSAQHEEEIQDYKQALSQDRAISQEKIAAFTAGRRAKSAELAGLVPQLTQQINGAKAAALGEIGSAETSGVAAVQAAVRNARSRVQAQARSARAQVEAGHSAAVVGMGAAASGARTAMDSDFRTAGEAVTGKQDEQITKLGELYGRTEQRIRDAAKEAGDLAAGEGKKRAEQYRAKMIHRDDNWWDGPLTDNRCKARADAATAVGDAYRKELPKAADEPIADMKKGRPDAEKTVRQVADDVRESLDTVLQQSRKGLADGHQQSVQGAADAKTAALQGIGQALGAAEASLAQLQSSQIAAIRGRAAQQRQAVERNAVGAIAAVTKGVTTARDGLDRSLKGFLKVLGQDETPDAEQLEEVLRNTGAQFDERLEGVAEQLRSQAGQAGASLAAAAKQAARGMAEAARSASESAVRTATSTGEALTSTASRTVSGLRQVQQSFAQAAKTMQSGCADANKQVLEGLDKAYTDLAGKFEQGADGQVKAIADALKKAATGTGKDEIHPKITEEADKAADKVKPRWHTVLTFIVVIVVVIALTIALGPLVIGAVGAIAGTLGASVAVAGVIGTIVGGAIVGAAAGAVGAMVSNVMNGAPLMEGVAKAALFGAIGGAIGGGASAAVAKTALGAGARVAVEMVVEVAVEIGLEVSAAAITGQEYSWQQAMLTAATTVAATGVMANPRVQALTHRVQLGSENLLGKIGLKAPESPSVKPPETGAPDAPKPPDTPKTPDLSGAPDVPGAPKTEAPTPDAPSAPKPDTPGPTPDGGTPGGTPQPGRGPDGATSWKPSDIDPTGGQGSADGPVRPRDQAGIEAELRSALGPLGDRVDLTVDPDLPGRTVRVHYDLDGDGLITNVRMTAGPNATPTDIRLHTPTARTMLRYSGLSGRVRNLLSQIGEWIGVHGKPPVGTRAWEAHLELRKLPDIIADRARVYADADPAARAELEPELNSLVEQFHTHAETLKAWNLDPGRGYVAADDPTRLLPPDAPSASRDMLSELISSGRELPPLIRDHPSLLRMIAESPRAMEGLVNLVNSARDLPGVIKENPFTLWKIAQDPKGLAEFFDMVGSGRDLPEVIRDSPELWASIAHSPGGPYELCKLINDGYRLPEPLTRDPELFQFIADDPLAIEGLFRLLRRRDALSDRAQNLLFEALVTHGDAVMPLLYNVDKGNRGSNRLNTREFEVLVESLQAFPDGLEGLPRLINLVERGTREQLQGALGELRIAARLQQGLPEGQTVEVGHLLGGKSAGDIIVRGPDGDIVQIVEVKSYDWSKYNPSQQRGKAEEFARQRNDMIDRYAEELDLPRDRVESMYGMAIIGETLPESLLIRLAELSVHPDQNLAGIPSRL